MSTATSQLRRKFFRLKAVAVDEVAKTIRFRVSTNDQDRDGEIVEQSWDWKNFLSNPIALWGHKSDEPENVIGTWSDFETTDDGAETFATLHVDDDINPKASLIWKQLVKRTLRTASIGFITGDVEYQDTTPVLKHNEVIEISVVPIPANPRAVTLALKAGEISRKDATWLMDSMRSEAEFISKQLEVSDDTSEENAMNEETQKQLGTLVDAMTKMATAQEATNKHLEQVVTKMDETRTKGAVTDIVNADDGWDVNEAKYMAMKDVGSVYYALCEAFFYTATPVSDFAKLLTEAVELWQQIADGTFSDGDETGVVSKAAKAVDSEKVKALIESMHTKSATTTTDEPAEPNADESTEDQGGKPTETESKADKPKTDDLAKGGDNDQPGATDGQIEDDTELTPELQAEIDAEFDKREQEAKAA